MNVRAFNRGAVSVCTLVILLSGCSGGAARLAPSASHSNTVHASTGPKLYVSNRSGNTVTIYAPGSNEPQRTIKDLTSPGALAFDSSGNLYVANCSICSGSGSINVYAAGTNTLLRTITQGIVGPWALAFDRSGNLYVSELNYRNNVVVFAPGGTQPMRTITDGINRPGALGFDAAGDLYVLNDGTPNVTAYAPGSDAVMRTISKGIHIPYNMQFDSAGYLYILNSNFDFQGRGDITVYAPGGDSVIRTIKRGILRPFLPLVLDTADNVYVADCGEQCLRTAGGTVKEFSVGSKSLIRTVTKDIHFPTSMTFDDSGNLYVGSGSSNRHGTGNGHVTVYAPDGTTVIRTVSQGIDYPLNIATGP